MKRLLAIATLLALNTPAFAQVTQDFSASPPSVTSGGQTRRMGGTPYVVDDGAAPAVTPSVTSSTGGLAIGSGAVATTGAGAVAIGTSYTSGANSLSAIIQDSTNTYGAQGTASIAIGRFNRAAGTQATALGGGTNVASGNFSLATGNATTASGSQSFSGGFQSTASASQTFAFGDTATASTNNAVAFGSRSVSSRWGALTLAGGRFTANGDAQHGFFSGFRQTTDATPVEVFLDNSSARFALVNNSTVGFDFLVTGRTSAGVTSTWQIRGAIKRGANAAATAIVGTPTVTVLGQDAGASSWAVAAVANTTAGSLNVNVTGAASTTINWVVSGRFVEDAF